MNPSELIYRYKYFGKEATSFCIWSIAGLILGLVSAVIAFKYGKSLNEGIVLAVIVIVVFMIYAGIRSNKFARKKVLVRKEYLSKLSSYSLDQLKQAAISQELDDKTKEMIIEWLNENHAGWSFDNSGKTLK